MQLVLDFARRRSFKLPGSSTPATSPGETQTIDLTRGTYRVSSTGPYVLESGVRATLDAFWGDDSEALYIVWPGGRFALASASGKACNVHVVPVVDDNRA